MRAGELILVGNAGARHELVKWCIQRSLFAWYARHSTGAVLCESQFSLGESIARIPDVAYIQNAKLELLPDADVPIPFAPDLAVEVISDSESAADAESKVNEYLAAGTAEVWQVYPRERRVRIRTATDVRDLTADQILTTPVLPGFSSSVQSFFSRAVPARLSREPS